HFKFSFAELHADFYADHTRTINSINMNKNITKIIYGTITLIIIIFVIFMYSKSKEVRIEENWKIYRNDELNIETKLPEGMEIEVEKNSPNSPNF
ncbi:MAG: hypothetical protein V1860_01060, partial [bacterium]